MSPHDTHLSISGYLLGGMLVLGIVPLVGLFVVAAWRYPLAAAVVLALFAFLTVLHRWRVPSTDVDRELDDEWRLHR